MIPLICNVQNWLPGTKRRAMGEQGVNANEYGVSFQGDQNVLRLDSSNGCNNLVNILKPLYTHKIRFYDM